MTLMREHSYDRSDAQNAREAFEDFLASYPNHEKAAQAKQNLADLGNVQTGGSLKIADYYYKQKQFRAAVVYYNDVIRQQPNSPDSQKAKTRLDTIRSKFGEKYFTDKAPRPRRTGTARSLPKLSNGDGRLPAQTDTAKRPDYVGPPVSAPTPPPAPASTASTAPTRVNPSGSNTNLPDAPGRRGRPRRMANRSRRPCRKASSRRCRHNRMKARRQEVQECAQRTENRDSGFEDRSYASFPVLPLFACCILTLPFSALLTGCAGYHLGEAKPAYMKDMHTIFIPVFRNNTLLPQVEGLVTDTVARQFQQDGTYTLTTREAADAVLNCTIERVTRTPERSVTGNVLLTSEFDLSLVVSYQLVDRRTNKVLDSGQANGTTSFFVGNDVTQDERQALPIAAEQLAVRLVSSVARGLLAGRM